MLISGTVICGHVIPRGFVFNGANIHIILVALVWLTRWHPKIRRGACIHDYWWTKGDGANPVEALKYYKRGNDYFRQAIKEDGCNLWQRFWIILGVSLSMRWRHLKKRWRVGK